MDFKARSCVIWYVVSYWVKPIHKGAKGIRNEANFTQNLAASLNLHS